MFFSFFKKVLFGCASLAARERARRRAHATQQTPSQTAAREAQKPPPRLSPDSCFEKKNREQEKKISFLCFFFFCLFDTEYGMHGDGPRRASPMRHLRSKIR